MSQCCFLISGILWARDSPGGTWSILQSIWCVGGDNDLIYKKKTRLRTISSIPLTPEKPGRWFSRRPPFPWSISPCRLRSSFCKICCQMGGTPHAIAIKTRQGGLPMCLAWCNPSKSSCHTNDPFSATPKRIVLCLGEYWKAHKNIHLYISIQKCKMTGSLIHTIWDGPNSDLAKQPLNCKLTG